MKYRINTTFIAEAESAVELPPGKTWDDVQSWYIKWDTLNIVFKDGTEFSEDLNSDSLDAIDWKRPQTVDIYAIEDGKTNYDRAVARE